MVHLVVLADQTGCESSLCNLLFDGLSDGVWADVIWQCANRLVIAASERTLHSVLLSVGVLVQHRSQVGHLVVLQWCRAEGSSVLRPETIVGKRAAVLVVLELALVDV